MLTFEWDPNEADANAEKHGGTKRLRPPSVIPFPSRLERCAEAMNAALRAHIKFEAERQERGG